MADFYIGEIRAFAFGFVPQGWLACNGQTVSVSQFNVLYAIIGNTYGTAPNGQFKLPNLTGATGQGVGLPMLGTGQRPGSSNNYALGQCTGVSAVTLTPAQLPTHTHTVTGIIAGVPPAIYSVPTTVSHLSRYVVDSKGSTYNAYSSNALPTPPVSLNASTLGLSGGGQAHDNMQPYLAFVFAIAYEGEFPQRP